jgi:hypothetical protein
MEGEFGMNWLRWVTSGVLLVGAVIGQVVSWNYATAAGTHARKSVRAFERLEPPGCRGARNHQSRLANGPSP